MKVQRVWAAKCQFCPRGEERIAIGRCSHECRLFYCLQHELPAACNALFPQRFGETQGMSPADGMQRIRERDG